MFENLRFLINRKIATSSSILLGTLILASSNISVFASSQTKMDLHIDGEVISYNSPTIKLNIDGKLIKNEELKIPPVIINDRVYVPVRDVFEKMGAEVFWEEDTGRVDIKLSDKLFTMTKNSEIVIVNGEKKITENSPKIVNDRVLIPIRIATESLGYIVDWKAETKIVSISSNDNVQPNSNNSADGFVVETPTELPPTQSEKATQSNSNTTMAKDLSTEVFQPMSYPTAKITSVALPTTQNAGVFTIVASSEISAIKKTILPDNRLVIDITNSTKAFTDSTLTTGNITIPTIRSAQSEENGVPITRIVFDFSSASDFSVSYSSDRKNIYVKLNQSEVTSISLKKEGVTDVIKIGTTSVSTANVFLLKDPIRLVADIPLSTQKADTTPETKGTHVSSIKLAQFDENTVRIVMELNKDIDYSVSNIGNEILISIREATYKNISYSSNEKRFVIKKEGLPKLDLQKIVYDDQYNFLKYTINLGVNIEANIGFGEININDNYIKSATIKTEDGSTKIEINEKKINVFKVSEDKENYYITAYNPKEIYKKVVLLDPGHGGKFPGTSGFGVTEKDLTVEITNKVLAIFKDDPNIKVYATRQGDYTIVATNPEDLFARANMANEIADLFISVHYNSIEKATVSGTEVFYFGKNKPTVAGLTSKAVADALHKVLIAELGLVDRKVKSAEYHVLNNNVPSALLEIGFLSNESDNMFLRSEIGKEKTANAIAKGINEILSNYNPR